MTTDVPAAKNPLPANRGHRLWFPAGVAALAAIGIGVIRFQPEMERNFKGWSTLAVVLLAVLLGLIWFLFLSRLAWRTRLVSAALLALSVFGVTKMIRLDGTTDGIGLPKVRLALDAHPDIADRVTESDGHDRDRAPAGKSR